MVVDKYRDVGEWFQTAATTEKETWILYSLMWEDCPPATVKLS